MEKQLLARRQKAEDSFNALNISINSIVAELQKYGVETVEQAQEELHRLQGEWRLINELLDSKKKTVSKEPAVIDATKVEGS